MTVAQSRKEHVPNKKASDLWAKVPECQRQDFNIYELIQDKYLRNSDTTNLMDENYDTCQIKDYGQMQEEIKTYKMSKLRKEIEFLETGMQRIRTKLRRVQQDPTLTHSTSIVGLRLKQLGDQHDYDEIGQGRHPVRYENDMCINPHTTVETHSKVQMSYA